MVVVASHRLVFGQLASACWARADLRPCCPECHHRTRPLHRLDPRHFRLILDGTMEHKPKVLHRRGPVSIHPQFGLEIIY
jgi:hypothetical protein